MYLGCDRRGRCHSSLLSRLCREAFLQQQRNDVGDLVAVDDLSTNRTLGALWFARARAIFASNQCFHQTRVAEQMTWAH